MNEASVTFIIPAYNAASFLERAVNSIKNQSRQDWRIIIVDDCSTDNTLPVANALAKEDNRIRVVRMSEPSGGAYQPRIKGVQLATTEFVAPLDADDWIGPDYLENMFKDLLKHQADLIYPTLYNSFGPDRSAQRFRPITHYDFYDTPLVGKECIKYTLDGWKIACGGGILRRSTYLESINALGSDFNYPSFCDELHTRHLLLKAGKVIISEEPYYYFKNTESVTQTLSLKQFYKTDTNLALLNLTKETFGVGSEEYLKAQRQNFHTIFDLLHDIKRSRMNHNELSQAYNKLKKAKGAVEWQILKGEVSWRLLLALRLLPLKFISLIR